MKNIKTLILSLFLSLFLFQSASAFSVVRLGPEYFPDSSKGRPISSANIYVGIPDLNPKTEANRKPISVRQEDGTIVAVTQPISTSAGGVPLYLGSPVTILVDGPYSLRVDNSSGSQIYYVPLIEATSGIGTSACYPDATEADQGVTATGSGSTIKDCVDTISTNEGTIVVTRGLSGTNTTYTLTTSETVPSNITLYFEPGALIDGAGTLTINGYIDDTRSSRIWGSSITLDLSGAHILWLPPEWWGAVGDGATDDSTAFQAAIDVAEAMGGATIKVSGNTYLVSELVIDDDNVILQGVIPGYNYGNDKTVSVLYCTSGVYCVYLSQGASHSGLENITLKSNGAFGAGYPHPVTVPGVEYGVVINTPVTTMIDVTVRGFQYGVAMVGYGAGNIFERCGFIWNTRVGFAVTGHVEAAFLLNHPNLAALAGYITTTVYQMNNTNIRRNGWGMILRDGTLTARGLIIESNLYGGVLQYESDIETGTSANWHEVHFENNYQGMTVATRGDYTMANIGNNMLLIAAATHIAWTAADDAGYQFHTDSETRSTTSGPGNNMENSTFSISSEQYCMRLLSSYLNRFYRSNCSGSTHPDLDVYLGAQSNATYFEEWYGPLPPSLGNRGVKVLIKRSGSSGLAFEGDIHKEGGRTQVFWFVADTITAGATVDAYPILNQAAGTAVASTLYPMPFTGSIVGFIINKERAVGTASVGTAVVHTTGSQVGAKSYTSGNDGTHTGANNAAVLTDSTQSWTVDALIGRMVYNTTDGSSALITDNDATTVTATLGGGTDDDWDTGDDYVICEAFLNVADSVSKSVEFTREAMPMTVEYMLGVRLIAPADYAGGANNRIIIGLIVEY